MQTRRLETLFLAATFLALGACGGMAGPYQPVAPSSDRAASARVATPPSDPPTTTASSAAEPLNVLGQPLATCSTAPVTGWYRDGSCRTDDADRGIHVVCAEVDEAFLTYTKSQGNDLSTPAPRYRFPGLKPGDRWCLCAARWAEAKAAGKAPPVVLSASDDKALTVVPLKTLERHAVQPRR